MPVSHTPGPWIADSWYVGPKDLPTLVKVNPNGPLGHEEVIANARLIAAAPDLLAALQTAYMAVCNWIPTNAGGRLAKDNALAKIDAAIAKATGA